MLATSSAADRPQSASSNTCPRLDVVSTEYHEQSSAITISGSTVRETAFAVVHPVARAVCRNMSAHCATNASSASVATERPTMTLDSHVLKRQMRGTSNTGSAE